MKTMSLTIARRRPGLGQFILAAAVASAALLAVPHVSHAQGIIGGMDEGARRGNRAAGPVGAIVGAGVGGAVGGVNGALGISPRYHRHHYHRRHRR